MSPNKFDIQSMEKGNDESVKEYVLRWHEMTRKFSLLYLRKRTHIHFH